MTDNTLRTAIARALFDREFWGLSQEQRDIDWMGPHTESYYANADAVLAVLADLPESVIERAAVDFKQAWHEADNESRQGERVTAGLRAAFRAAFGGEQSDG